MATSEPPPPGYSLDDDETVAHTTEAQPAPSSTSPAPESAVTPPSAQRSPPPRAEITAHQDPEAPSLPERPQEDDEFEDPRIASLHAIFPDFDAAVLLSVLESVGGDEDRAVDILLGMTDPDHVPTAQPPSPPVAARSQTELDEEYARRLMLEEEQNQRRAAEPALAYQPRARGATWEPQGRTHAQGDPKPDTMADVQEQFSKIAESGKRTFSSLVSKVKAKYQEYDQSRNGQGAQTGTEPSWGAPSGQSGVDRHTQQAYYAPTSEYRPRRGSTRDYEEAPEQSIVPARDNTSSPAGAPSHDPALVSSSAGVGRDHPETPRPPSTNSGPPPSNISPGKFGLLPKRPVSLVASEQPPRATVHDDDEDEELEYVENPFEETGHK